MPSQLPPPHHHQDAALPPNSPLQCRLAIRQLLMLPPPPEQAGRLHAAVGLLSGAPLLAAGTKRRLLCTLHRVCSSVFCLLLLVQNHFSLFWIVFR